MGLLAATALSSSGVVSDLAVVGAEIVRIAFRVGYHVTQIGEIVEQPSDLGPKAWSRAYLNINESAALAELDHLNKRQVCQLSLPSSSSKVRKLIPDRLFQR